MNVISFKSTIPLSTGAGAPVVRRVRLPGPFVFGLQVLTNLYGDTGLRLLTGAERVLPDPSSEVTDATLAGVSDGYYYPASSNWLDLRLVVPAYAGIAAVLEFVNSNGSTAAAVVVNLLVAAKPPDQETIEILTELRAGIDRWPNDATLVELARSLRERQSMPRG